MVVCGTLQAGICGTKGEKSVMGERDNASAAVLYTPGTCTAEY